MRYPICLILTLIALAPAALSGQSALFESIRNDDLAPVISQLEHGADVNAKDGAGATPLMHAALYGSAASVETLLDRGADANASDAAGATALMWGAGDAEKVRVLLAHGAAVNARSKSGRTPLINAAAVNGNVQTVRMLIKAGAGARLCDSDGVGPVIVASQTADAAILKELFAHGADANETITRQNQTALMIAAGIDSPDAVQVLLKAGADPNRQSRDPGANKVGLRQRGRMTALLWAAPSANPQSIQMLLDHGADPNALEFRGMNALMLAASSEVDNSGAVRLLLPRTSDVNIKDKGGLTALDWALRFGDSTAVHMLREAGVQSTKTSSDVPHPAPAGQTDMRQSIAKSVALMQKANTGFFAANGCLGCHHTMLGGMLAGMAKARGFAVDEGALSEQVKAMVAVRMPDREALLQHRRIGEITMSQSLLLVSLAALQSPASPLTDAIVHDLLALQHADGKWQGFDQRPPLEYSAFSETAYAIGAIRSYPLPGRRQEIQEHTNRAASWLLSAKAVTTEDKSMQLIGLKWAEAPEARLRGLASQLISQQRDDGGWAQRDGFQSDAYATGQVLYALNRAGQAPSSHPAYQRGIRYLLGTQYEDGSWFVRSRAVKFQPYFESGFPHGHDQWISAAATAWAAMSLTLATETPARRNIGQ